jgi:hypothetical protein
VRSRSRSPTGSHEWDGSVGRESACGVNVAKRLPPERWTLLTDGNYLCVQNEEERKIRRMTSAYEPTLIYGW